MELLSLSNDRPQGLRIIPALLPSLDKKRPSPQPKITFAPESSPRYTLNELVNLPNAELHCYLRSVEASCICGNDIDSDLHLIRRAQEFFRRMDSQYESWMNAVRAELDALFENLNDMRNRICGEIRDHIKRNCRGMVESNIVQKRASENTINDVRERYRAEPNLMALAKCIWEIRRCMKEIAELDEEFPVEKEHGIQISAQGAHVNLDNFNFLPGSQGSEIQRYIAQAHDKLNEFDRQQEENSRRVQALIQCEGSCYRNRADDRDWPLPDARF